MAPPGIITDELFRAFRIVESGDDVTKVTNTPDGKAIGAYQITQKFWRDAVAVDPTLAANKETHEKCTDQYYSERVMQALIGKWAGELNDELHRDAKLEDIVRMYKGGKKGYKDPKTLDYWKEIKEHLKKK